MEKSKVLISIIVPIYNAEKYLEECIQSIILQSYKNLEIILIDDGSNDNSGKICDEYALLDSRIQVIHQKNGGSVVARKSGLKIAKGRYIGFVDADDYIDANMFEVLYSKIAEYDVDFVESGIIVGEKKDYMVDAYIVDFQKNDNLSYFLHNIFDKCNIHFCLWSKLFRCDVIKEAYMQLPDYQSYGEDLLCLCHYLLNCKKFYICNDAFYHYRVYDGSMSHKNWLDMWFEESKLYEEIRKYLEKNKLLQRCESSLRRYYKKRLLSILQKQEKENVVIFNYKFSNVGLLKNKKIVIYGAGVVGESYYYQISKYNQCEVVAWIDKEKESLSDMIRIEKPEYLKEIEYDVVLLAVKKESVADEIKQELLDMKFCFKDTVFIWREPETINNF